MDIVVRHSRVASGDDVFILASTQERRSSPVVCGSAYEPSWQPLFVTLLLFAEARQFEPHVSTCVGMSCRQWWSISACCDVCCMLHGSRDSCVWLHPKILDFHSIMRSFDQKPPDTTQKSRAAVSLGTAWVVWLPPLQQISSCSSCESKNVPHRRHPPSLAWL